MRGVGEGPPGSTSAAGGPRTSGTAMIHAGPEQLFGLDGLEFLDDGSIVGTMASGAWLSASGSTDGPGELAGLGVLIDVTLGYAGVQLSSGWALSTEISVDVVGPVPVDGSPIRCRARVVQQDAEGALVMGEVTAAERAVAHCVMRMRFVDRTPEEVQSEQLVVAHPRTSSGGLAALLAPETTWRPGGGEAAVSARFANPLGHFHGGMVLTLAEWFGSRAAPQFSSTGSVRLTLVRGVPSGDSVSITTTSVHEGRTLGLVEVTFRDSRGRTTALATVTRH